MLTIREWMELVDYRISEGSTYDWKCFGDHAYSLDSWGGGHDGYGFHITFDTTTQVVFEVQAHDYVNHRAYRIINPAYIDLHREEARRHGSSEALAWEGVDYVDLEVDDDFIQKALAIKSGESYDTRVSVPFDLPDEDLLNYMKLAHARDITFNQLITEALQAAIEEHKNDPEGMQSKMERWKANHE